jgi:predicted transposase YbfD/YdcC
MLILSGKARDGVADRRLAWSLAGIAGALNAAGFYAVGENRLNWALDVVFHEDLSRLRSG